MENVLVLHIKEMENAAFLVGSWMEYLGEI